MEQEYSVLIVDDEPSVIRALRRVFLQEQYNLLTAENPEDALSLIRSNKIDLIICDHQMPNMSGSELLSHTRRISPDTIRMLITGINDINIAISAINEGRIYHYIAKPWKNDEVRKVVKEALALKRKRKEMESIQQMLSFSKNYLLDVSEKLNMISRYMAREEQSAQTSAKRRQTIGKLSVYEDDNIILIDIPDIIYLSAESGHVSVVTGKGRYISHDPLNTWEKNLERYNFFRCHRSYVINVDHITRISPWINGAYIITLRDLDESIPVSRNRMKYLKRIISL